MNPTDDPRDEALSRLYREAPKAEAPPALDRAILAAAAKAVVPVPRRKSFWDVWRLPVTAIATVMLTATLLLQHLDQPGQPGQQAPAASVPMAPSSGAAPAPATKADSAVANQTEEKALVVERKKSQARQLQEVELRAFPRDVEASPPPAAAPAAPANVRSEPPMIQEKAEARAAEITIVPRRADLSAQDANAKAGPGAAAFAAKPPVGALGDKADTESPDRQLERIRELRRAGRQADADAALAEFRRRYPDYPLPQDLKP